ncbi:MAG: glycosyltransferase family 87 protein [Planctomycetota bacterium]
MPPMPPQRAKRLLLVLCLLVSLLAIIQGMHRARKGRNALLKWAPVYTALERGEAIYNVGEEGYPTPPVTLLLMAPFQAAGPAWGPFWWALFQVGLAWLVVLIAWDLVQRGEPPLRPMALGLVLLLCLRMLHSEIQHANINLWVATSLAGAAWAWRGGRPVLAGMAIGFGAGLKVTPLLGVLLFVRWRSARGLLGVAAGLLLALALPALWLGSTRTVELTQGWARQMLLPYLEGRGLGLRQTEQINQSLLGFLGRFLTDGVAIPAEDPWPTHDIRVGLVHLSPAAFQYVHRAALAAVLLVTWFALGRRARTDGTGSAGAFGLIALAMLLASERSWKQHHVVLPLAAAFLAAQWARADRRRARVAFAGLVWAIVWVLGSGDGVLGRRGADWAEALGAYTWATLGLFAAVAWCLAHGAPPVPARADFGSPEPGTVP